MPIGWYLLAIAILNPRLVTIEEAEDIFYGNGSNKEIGSKRQTIRSTIEEMYALKKSGMTYKEVASIYGISKGACHKRIVRFFGKEKEPAARKR